jgi:hypothetical protein
VRWANRGLAKDCANAGGHHANKQNREHFQTRGAGSSAIYFYIFHAHVAVVSDHPYCLLADAAIFAVQQLLGGTFRCA